MHSALYRKLCQRDVSKFQIQFCVSLFFMLIVFASGINRTQVYGVCVTMSALIHYFTLVTWMWMGSLAVNMYQKLVIVFVHISTRYIIAVSLVCWCKFPEYQNITFPVTMHHQMLLLIHCFMYLDLFHHSGTNCSSGHFFGYWSWLHSHIFITYWEEHGTQNKTVWMMHS